MRLLVSGEDKPLIIDNLKWTSIPEYSGDLGMYVFSPQLPEGYALDSTADPLEFDVVVRTAPAKTRIAGGGTATRPYEISTPEQLIGLSRIINGGKATAAFGTEEVYIKLTNDIDFKDYNNTSVNKSWVAIGTTTNPFKGHFDGGHKVIHNLTGKETTATPYGLFGKIGTNGIAVQNLGLVNLDLESGIGVVGGVVGLLQEGDIVSCFSTGKIASNAHAGGVAGLAAAGPLGTITIKDCYSTADISASLVSGGIAGLTNKASIENCYSTGKIYATSAYGIAMTDSTSKIHNSMALNKSIGDGTGSLFGIGSHAASDYSGNITFDRIEKIPFLLGNYVTTGLATDQHGAGKTALELQTLANMPVGFDSGNGNTSLGNCQY